ncbi:MAG: hypothetical protein BIFFINMI_03515 [Phycisphaerae bacterium]|nr:hypothetical protein [Phycisphaerae bacterium]
MGRFRAWLTRRNLIIGGVVISIALAASYISLGVHLWSGRHELTSEEMGFASFPSDEPFQHMGFLVWKTRNKEVFYALATATSDFEPNNPSPSYNYLWSTDKGGSLTIDDRKIEYSPTGRLLAPDPFGRFVELELNDEELKILDTHAPRQLFEKIVLPRLWSFSGDLLNGKRHGHWVCSDRSGHKAWEGDYVDGLRDGRWVYFRIDGRPLAELSYKQGHREGTWTYYAEDGSIKDALTWRNDLPVEHPVHQSSIGFAETLSPDGSWSSRMSSH